MKMPEILQGEARTRFLQGIAFGAVAAMTIGFMWGGWVTGGTARSMTMIAENNGRMSVLVPMCVNLIVGLGADPERANASAARVLNVWAGLPGAASGRQRGRKTAR